MKKSSIYIVSLIVLAGLTTSAVYAAATIVPFTPPYQLQDTTNGNVVRLNIDSAGYVGIGTTNPQQELSVSGSYEPFIAVTNTGMSGSPSVYIGMNQGNNAAMLVTTAGKDIKFWNGQYSMTILGNNGYVGIGTTNPQQELDVSGNMRLTGNIISPNDICIGSC